MEVLWEVSLGAFLVVTVILGGALAYAIGRSTALNWSGWGILAVYTGLLTLAARFIHYSLFDGTFLLPPETSGTALYYAAVDFLVLFGFATFGRRWTRREQVARQYGFLKAGARGTP